MEYHKAPYWASVYCLYLAFLSAYTKHSLRKYADDNTRFPMNSSELEVINKIKNVVKSLSLWFQNNFMKMNLDEFRLLLSDRKIHQVDICDEKLSSKRSENLLAS